MSPESSWTCGNCEQSNTDEFDRCRACDTPRSLADDEESDGQATPSAEYSTPATPADDRAGTKTPHDAAAPLPSMGGGVPAGPALGSGDVIEELRQLIEGVPWGFTWIVITLLYLILTFKY